MEAALRLQSIDSMGSSSSEASSDSSLRPPSYCKGEKRTRSQRKVNYVARLCDSSDEESDVSEEASTCSAGSEDLPIQDELFNRAFKPIIVSEAPLLPACPVLSQHLPQPQPAIIQPSWLPSTTHQSRISPPRTSAPRMAGNPIIRPITVKTEVIAGTSTESESPSEIESAVEMTCRNLVAKVLVTEADSKSGSSNPFFSSNLQKFLQSKRDLKVSFLEKANPTINAACHPKKDVVSVQSTRHILMRSASTEARHTSPIPSTSAYETPIMIRRLPPPAAVPPPQSPFAKLTETSATSSLQSGITASLQYPELVPQTYRTPKPHRVKTKASVNQLTKVQEEELELHYSDSRKEAGWSDEKAIALLNRSLRVYKDHIKIVYSSYPKDWISPEITKNAMIYASQAIKVTNEIATPQVPPQPPSSSAAPLTPSKKARGRPKKYPMNSPTGQPQNASTPRVSGNANRSTATDTVKPEAPEEATLSRTRRQVKRPAKYNEEYILTDNDFKRATKLIEQNASDATLANGNSAKGDQDELYDSDSSLEHHHLIKRIRIEPQSTPLPPPSNTLEAPPTASVWQNGEKEALMSLSSLLYASPPGGESDRDAMIRDAKKSIALEVRNSIQLSRWRESLVLRRGMLHAKLWKVMLSRNLIRPLNGAKLNPRTPLLSLIYEMYPQVAPPRIGIEKARNVVKKCPVEDSEVKESVKVVPVKIQEPVKITKVICEVSGNEERGTSVARKSEVTSEIVEVKDEKDIVGGLEEQIEAADPDDVAICHIMMRLVTSVINSESPASAQRGRPMRSILKTRLRTSAGITAPKLIIKSMLNPRINAPRVSATIAQMKSRLRPPSLRTVLTSKAPTVPRFCARQGVTEFLIPVEHRMLIGRNEVLEVQKPHLDDGTRKETKTLIDRSQVPRNVTVLPVNVSLVTRNSIKRP